MNTENMPKVQVEAEGVEVMRWLKILVGEELLRLGGMRKPGTPSGEVKIEGADGTVRKMLATKLTADTWVRAIMEQYRVLEPVDEKRLRKGFVVMGNRAKFWPQPVDLWPCVEDREESPEVIDRRFQRELARRKDVEERLDNPPAKPELLAAPEGMKKPDRAERDKTQRAATIAQIQRLQNITTRKEGRRELRRNQYRWPSG